MSRQSKVTLHFGKVTGKHRLSRPEEEALAAKGEAKIGEELLGLIGQAMKISLLESFTISDARKRLNSLVWVYLELASPRVVKNLEILSAWAGLDTINKLARKAEMNASFIGRLFNMTAPGGWTFGQVIRLSAALEIDPRVLLFSDLGKLIQEQEALYKK